jgi:outer membrane murein-binding lipoprotein Lpp
VRTRAAILAVVAVTGMALAGCDRDTVASAPTVSSSSDQLGSLEASVDAISRQVDSDASG